MTDSTLWSVAEVTEVPNHPTDWGDAHVEGLIWKTQQPDKEHKMSENNIKISRVENGYVLTFEGKGRPSSRSVARTPQGLAALVTAWADCFDACEEGADTSERAPITMAPGGAPHPYAE